MYDVVNVAIADSRGISTSINDYSQAFYSYINTIFSASGLLQ
ncbi:MAG: hypothetical protein RM338_25895 [Nostoc sp. DedQUE12a]|nr:hypothetical protein [Nostoc sp. DedQUE12a]